MLAADDFSTRQRAGGDWGGGLWPVKTTRGKAFALCSQLNTVVLGDGLKKIGELAFFECTSIHDITIPPAVKLIEVGAFARCSQTVTVVLWGGLEEIGAQAFSDRTSLHDVTIPPAVKTIEEGTFNRCSQLTTGGDLEDSIWRMYIAT